VFVDVSPVSVADGDTVFPFEVEGEFLAALFLVVAGVDDSRFDEVAAGGGGEEEGEREKELHCGGLWFDLGLGLVGWKLGVEVVVVVWFGFGVGFGFGSGFDGFGTVGSCGLMARCRTVWGRVGAVLISPSGVASVVWNCLEGCGCLAIGECSSVFFMKEGEDQRRQYTWRVSRCGLSGEISSTRFYRS
jgi:hypothetical protein